MDERVSEKRTKPTSTVGGMHRCLSVRAMQAISERRAWNEESGYGWGWPSPPARRTGARTESREEAFQDASEEIYEAAYENSRKR